jgi:hypothetical protein
MYLIVIAWLYVTLLMGLAEAFSSQGTVLGAIITFLLYGVAPMSLVVYVMGTPLRRKSKLRADAQAQNAPTTESSVAEPDASGHATRVSQDSAVPSVRKEP